VKNGLQNSESLNQYYQLLTSPANSFLAFIQTQYVAQFHRALPPGYFFLGGTRASLNAFARRNFTTVLAGILMASPV